MKGGTIMSQIFPAQPDDEQEDAIEETIDDESEKAE
jgi:hypothetical protein